LAALVVPTPYQNNTWAVRVPANSAHLIASIASHLPGITYRGQLFEQDAEYHLIDSTTSTYEQVMEFLQSLPYVEWFQHQVARQQYERFDSFEPLYAMSWFLHANPGTLL
jgi:hypothetical protein